MQPDRPTEAVRSAGPNPRTPQPLTHGRAGARSRAALTLPGTLVLLLVILAGCGSSSSSHQGSSGTAASESASASVDKASGTSGPSGVTNPSTATKPSTATNPSTAGKPSTASTPSTATGAPPNGVAAASPEEILAASRAAVASASSVHVEGKAFEGRQAFAITMDLTRGGAQGQTSGILEIGIIRTGNTLYVKANPSTDRHLGGAHASPGSWIEAPANGPRTSQLAQLSYLNGEVGRLATIAVPPSVTKGATAVVDGQPVIELKERGGLHGGGLYLGRLFIATTGQPYPIEMIKRGQETGYVIFSNWDRPVTITPPANAVAAR